MSARRRKRRKKGSLPPSRWWLLGLAATLVLLAVGVAWLRSPSGRLLLADRGVGAAQDWARGHVESVLMGRLEGLGVPADSIRVERDPGGGPTLVRVPAPGTLLEFNLALTEAIEDAGGTVHRGRRHERAGEVWIELQVGTRRQLTHRVVAQREQVAPAPPPLPRGRLALIIDDLGHNLNGLTRRALALPGPVTFAVLPELGRSARVLTEIHRAGKPAFLHLPMEPDPASGYEAGEPQIRVGMDPPRIRTVVERTLDGLPGVVGVNNHMGSKATRSRPEMDAVMAVLAERGLPFLDSLTTPRSVAHLAAEEAGVPVLRNDIFLDASTEDPEKVLERLRFLERRARQRGWAVGIGHVNEATVSALERFLPTLRPGDVELVGIAELIHDRAR